MNPHQSTNSTTHPLPPIYAFDFDGVLSNYLTPPFTLFPSAIEMLTFLKNNKQRCWLLTARPPHTQDDGLIAELKRHNLLDAFEHIEIGCMNSQTNRPNKGAHLHEMCRKYGIDDKNRINFFDDTDENISHARDHGFQNVFKVNPKTGVSLVVRDT